MSLRLRIQSLRQYAIKVKNAEDLEQQLDFIRDNIPKAVEQCIKYNIKIPFYVITGALLHSMIVYKSEYEYNKPVFKLSLALPDDQSSDKIRENLKDLLIEAGYPYPDIATICVGQGRGGTYKPLKIKFAVRDVEYPDDTCRTVFSYDDATSLNELFEVIEEVCSKLEALNLELLEKYCIYDVKKCTDIHINVKKTVDGYNVQFMLAMPDLSHEGMDVVSLVENFDVIEEPKDCVRTDKIFILHI